MDITEVREHLTGMSHSGTLNKVRNFEALLERAANTVLSKLDPLETVRTTPLSQAVHDDVYNYSLPSDFKKPIDLLPQDDRKQTDVATRFLAEQFDFQKLIREKTISIESDSATKFLRMNWRSRQGKTYHAMNDIDADGTWSAVDSAANIVEDTLYKISGSASIRFDLVASGDGLQNTDASALDLTDWDEQADWFMWLYFGSVTNLTSISARWGNDLTTNYWTSVAQTAQADGTAFKVGWNLIRFPWSTATETGTVAPATIDSFRFTIVATGAISDIRADNIIVSLGRLFDIKYYSKYIFRNSSGTWMNRPSSDSDTVALDEDANQIFLLESLKNIAQQVEGEDSAFDINYANKELHGDPSALDPVARMGLYSRYRMEHPSQSKKAVMTWTSGPRLKT